MPLRNSLFRLYNRFKNSLAYARFMYLDPRRFSQNLSDEYRKIKDFQDQDNYLKNIENIALQKLDDHNKKKYSIIHEYLTKGIHDSKVDILEKIDQLDLVKDLKAIEEAEEKYDPEIIELERLKAKAILNEPGYNLIYKLKRALENFKKYIENRPYCKKYHGWADAEEQKLHGFLG